MPALITALGKWHGVLVRSHAAEALGEIGPAASNAVPALTAALTDAHSDVRWPAAEALGRIGAAASGAVPALAPASGDPYGPVRLHA
ncbi:MAG: HEAT repeat domain-containing protein, partial [Rhodoplanes sp.]